MIWVNQIIQGVLLGGAYALIAAGLSFLFGVMRVINLAHGSLAILGAFLLLVIDRALGISPFAGLLIMVPAMALIGAAFQVLVLERALAAGALVPLLATFGLALIIDNVLFSIFGADSRSFAADIGTLSYASWTLTPQIYIGELNALIFAAAIAVLGAMQILLSATSLGRMIRAVAEDPDAAGLSGVDARRVRIIATMLALAMTGIAGAALGLQSGFSPYAGAPLLITAFEAVVIGGTGSLWGTLLGGIALGVAQNIGAEINPHLSQLAGHAVFLAVLVGRVRGLGGFAVVLRRPRRFA